MTYNILITGGTGFIGKHLVNRLATTESHISILTRNIPQKPIAENVEYLQGDYLDIHCLHDALQGKDIVYHLAVTTTPGTANNKIVYDAQTNLIGSLNVIRVSAVGGIKRFIFISSGGSVYGVTGNYPVAENHPTDPISAHGVSKLAIEKYLMVYRHVYGMEYRIVRGGNPYGEGQDPNRGQGFITYGLAQLAQDREIAVWGDGSVVRDYIYVGDFVKALTLMLNDSSPYKLYNVASGQGTSLNELVALFQSITGIQAKVEYQPGRKADVPYNCLDITRIESHFNWTPKTSLVDGLAKTWMWIQTQISVKTI